jgi:hypothetical protein
MFPAFIILYRFNKYAFMVFNFLLLVGGMLTIALIAAKYNLTVGILTFEDYYLFSYQFNKPFTKLPAMSLGMFMGLIYMRLLKYRKASLAQKKSEFPIMHYLKNSWTFGVFLYLYGAGALMTVTSIPLHANADSYSWSKAENVSYFAFGRFGYLTAIMCWCSIIFFGFGDILRRLLSQPIYISLSKLCFGAYLVYPIVIGFSFYATNKPIFIDYKTVVYLFLIHIAICFLVALPLYLFVQAPIDQIMNLLKKTFFEKKPVSEEKEVPLADRIEEQDDDSDFMHIDDDRFERSNSESKDYIENKEFKLKRTHERAKSNV